MINEKELSNALKKSLRGEFDAKSEAAVIKKTRQIEEASNGIYTHGSICKSMETKISNSTGVELESKKCFQEKKELMRSSNEKKTRVRCPCCQSFTELEVTINTVVFQYPLFCKSCNMEYTINIVKRVASLQTSV